MTGMTKTKRRKKAAAGSGLTLSIADYYRAKLTGQLPPSAPTFEEYLSYATPGAV